MLSRSTNHVPPPDVTTPFVNKLFLEKASAVLVLVYAAVGIYDVTYAPASNCALVTEPFTVNVRLPAVGVKVKTDLALAVVPLNVPVNVPDNVTVPVP